MKLIKGNLKRFFSKWMLTGLVCLLIPVIVMAQKQQITGVIIDAENNETMVGVTVHIKGTTVGTSSDMDGKFSISAAENDVLRFTFVGYKPYEYKIPAQVGASLKIFLETDAAQISEVVVEAGIIQRDKPGFTGAFSSFKQEELKNVGNINVLQTLKTLDPAFIIVENNMMGSNPNVLANIELRGQTTMDINSLRDEVSISSNLPLFVLDGFETTLQVVNDLDINRIESITLLKDAGSTAIYGSKGANGVVVIETVKPKTGQMFVNYNGSYRVAVPDLSVYNMMNAAEKLEFERLAGRYNYSSVGVTTPEIGQNSDELDYVYNQMNYYERLAYVQSGIDTYWLSEPVRLAFTQDHSLTVSSGKELQYIAGINYRINPGVMKGSERNSYGGNLKLVYRGEKGFNILNDISVMNTLGRDGSWGSFSDFVNANPYYVKRNEDGTIPKYLDRQRTNSGTTSTAVNPLYNASLNSRGDNTIFNVTNNTAVDWKMNDKLMLRGSLSLWRERSNYVTYTDPSHSKYDGKSYDLKGEYRSRYNVMNSYDVNLSGNYTEKVAKNNFTLIARAQLQQSNLIDESLEAVGFPEGSVGYPSQAFSYKSDSRPSYSETMRRSVGFITAFNYNYDYRYLLDVNYNTEGSSSFGRNKRFQSFWSVGVGWNIDRESFAKNWTWLKELKLRATYGMNGNDNVNVVTQSVYSFYPGSNIFGQPTYLSQVGNPDLRWQVVEKASTGVDMAMLEGNLRFNFDLFRHHTDPLIVQLDQRPSSGVNNYPFNLGYLNTTGYEFKMSYNVINNQSKRLLVNVTLTGSQTKSIYGGFADALNGLNEAYKRDNDDPNYNANLSLQSLQRYVDGHSPNDLWAVRSLGIDPATGRELFLKKNGEQTYIYDSNDRVVIANSRPDIQGIVGLNVRYKKLTANFYLRYYVGAHSYNTALFNKVENITRSGIVYNQDKRALYDRWKTAGDISQFRSISLTDIGQTPTSSRFIQKDNYVRGESAMVKWSFAGEEWLKKLKMEDLTISISTSDIFTLSSIKIERGIDYPFQRSVQMSVSARF